MPPFCPPPEKLTERKSYKIKQAKIFLHATHRPIRRHAAVPAAAANARLKSHFELASPMVAENSGMAAIAEVHEDQDHHCWRPSR